MAKELYVGKRKILVVPRNQKNKYLTASDKEMDKRAQSAINAALLRAKKCDKPIAKYDYETKEAYLEYPDGRRVNV